MNSSKSASTPSCTKFDVTFESSLAVTVNRGTRGGGRVRQNVGDQRASRVEKDISKSSKREALLTANLINGVGSIEAFDSKV